MAKKIRTVPNSQNLEMMSQNPYVRKIDYLLAEVAASKFASEEFLLKLFDELEHRYYVKEQILLNPNINCKILLDLAEKLQNEQDRLLGSNSQIELSEFKDTLKRAHSMKERKCSQ